MLTCNLALRINTVLRNKLFSRRKKVEILSLVKLEARYDRGGDWRLKLVEKYKKDFAIYTTVCEELLPFTRK